MKVLLVGAGAVGQVYGRHLALGGARVSFLVRPKYAEECRAGMVLYELRSRRERTPVTLVAEQILTTVDEVRAERWDQVWVCISAAALDEAWLAELAGATGDATIVALPPGMDAQAIFERHVSPARLVLGMIGVISYQAPLPGEEVPVPGVAYVIPGMSPSAFGGPRAESVVDALRRGACPAVVRHDIGDGSAFGSAILMPNVAGLEAAGWSLQAFRDGPMLTVAAAAAREALDVVAARLGVPTPWFTALVRGSLLRIAFTLAPRMVPFDLEEYLRYHFTKVGDQTRLLLASYVRDGTARGAELPAIGALSRELDGVGKAAALPAAALAP